MAQKPKVDPHVGRLGYLQALVTEFQETESQDAKEQVLANLANFAYDPNNYQYLRQLQVLDLFLDSLSEENENLVEFAIGALSHSSNASTAEVWGGGGATPQEAVPSPSPRPFHPYSPAPTLPPPSPGSLLYNPCNKYLWSASCTEYQGLDLKARTFWWGLAVSKKTNLPRWFLGILSV
ncbi:armadillo repeat-containing protein 7 isoform X2 [Herpailurus yagouaroundi]|uniref:armadillo repeat-containing protein 7 isoform X2 n=1 Tax=Herpailurus yagouaroundi TaxID=1608482 RepID=UPI001AD6908E|nr:armadillo repeat-containing protein 7 isoform X2 [Puma yagouaroundi]